MDLGFKAKNTRYYGDTPLFFFAREDGRFSLVLLEGLALQVGGVEEGLRAYLSGNMAFGSGVKALIHPGPSLLELSSVSCALAYEPNGRPITLVKSTKRGKRRCR